MPSLVDANTIVNFGSCHRHVKLQRKLETLLNHNGLKAAGRKAY